MNLDALKQLTTRELVEISEAAGKIIEDRLTGAIKKFFEMLVEKKVEAKLPKVEENMSIVVEMSFDKWDYVQALISDQKLIPPLGVAGVDPKFEVEFDGGKYRFTVFLQNWPESWSLLRDMDDAFLNIPDALEIHGDLFTE